MKSQLRRELTSELRAQASDEVASLRAELAALRANLEVLFDTDLQHRPALETERTAVHTFGRVISSRIDTEDAEDPEPVTDESPIIDVPEEPHPPGARMGSHARAGWRAPQTVGARAGRNDLGPHDVADSAAKCSGRTRGAVAVAAA